MMIYEDFIKSMQATFHLAVHQHNYKNGAFKSQIAEDTPVVSALDTFIASSVLSAAEKAKFNDFRTKLICLEADRAQSHTMSESELLMRIIDTGGMTVC